MRLASHLRMSVQRCKKETTSREFVEWLEWLDRREIERDKDFTRDQQYLARIAMEIHNSNRKKALPLDKFQLKFQRRRLGAVVDPKEKTSKSKNAWGLILGESKHGNRGR